MRIGIDLRCTTDHFPGIGRYMVGMVRALAALPHPHTLVLIVNPALPTTRHDLPALATLPCVELVAVDAGPFSLREQLALPRQVRKLRLDIFHAPYYVMPYVGLPRPVLLTVYDLIGRRFPEALSARGRLLYRLLMGLAVRRADRILTISASAQADIAHFYGLPPGEIAVVYGAVDARFQPQPAAEIAALRARYALDHPYVLYVGSNKPHKNLPRLVCAWERVRSRLPATQAAPLLLLAGHYDPRSSEAHRLVQARGLEAAVRFLPNVAEADLPALYSGAELFVFPSFYEGFGLPPLEALACGVPVACANASSLPEVVGSAARLFDPFDVDEMADTITHALTAPALRAQLRVQGIQQAQRFSWERTAQATLAAYEELARGALPAAH